MCAINVLYILCNKYMLWYVMLLCIVHTNVSINGKIKTFPCTKLSTRNGMCENGLSARAPRAQPGSC